jgi:16S rRNA processing protein RimM
LSTDEQVTIGRVVRVHGLRGEVVVEALSDVPGRFDPGAAVVVDGTPHTVTSSRPHQGRLLVTFDGIVDRTAAEGLRGREVTATRADVSDQDTYYAHELVGMAVVLEDGTWVGDVVDLVEIPERAGYDLLEVDTDGHRWLLPAADELVEVADADGVDVLCVVDPPAGLLPGDEDAADVVAPDQLED